jgi:hypothetical protein
VTILRDAVYCEAMTLPDAVLELVAQGYRTDAKSLPQAILDERKGS